MVSGINNYILVTLLFQDLVSWIPIRSKFKPKIYHGRNMLIAFATVRRLLNF